MDVSKYMATGSEIKHLGLKLQGIIEPESLSEQEKLLIKSSEEIKKVPEKAINPGVVVAGLLLILVMGTFILLHFW